MHTPSLPKENRSVTLTPDIICSFIEEQMSLFHIPGMAACVVKEDSLSWVGTYGYADLDKKIEVHDSTLFMIASVSKTITATALMTLYDKNAFRLDDEINDYLPFAIRNPNFSQTGITFEMLLTHTSGVKDNWPKLMPLIVPGDSPIIIEEFLKDYLISGGAYYDGDANFHDWKPGDKFSYSNIGFTTIGYLVEMISGQSFDKYCREHLFDPLEMAKTSWFLQGMDVEDIAVPYPYEDGVFRAREHFGYPDYPAGQLRSNILELSHILTVYMQKGTYRNQHILDKKTVELMTTMKVPIPDAMGIGLCWFEHYFGGRSLWEHGGTDPGVRTEVLFDPIEKIGVIVLTNGADKALTSITAEIFKFALSQHEEG